MTCGHTCPVAIVRITRAFVRSRLVRFGLTGLAGFAADFGCLTGMHSGLAVPLAMATTVAYIVGGTVHYSLTRFWVFPQPVRSGEISRIVRYLLLASVNVAVTLAIVLGLNRAGVDYRIAKVIAVVVLFLSNYFITPRFVMTSAGNRISAPPDTAASKKSE